MRLITKSVYRAFPELDRYDDAQCERFVRSARGGIVRQAVGAALMLVLLLAGEGGCAYLLPSITTMFRGRFDPTNPNPVANKLVGLCAAMLLLSPPPVLAFILRDVLLRRRVRFVLRVRGTCGACWYSLVGLPVGEANTVRCPECGVETEVDSSLGELVLDSTGQIKFQTGTGPADLKRGFWTPDRTRRWRRATLWVVGAGLATLLLVAGGYEAFIRLQARSAAAAWTGPADLNALIEKHQPAGTTASDANGWDDIHAAIEAAEAVEQRIRAQGRFSPRGRLIRPGFEYLWLNIPPQKNQTSEEVEDAADSRLLALALLEEYTQAGIFENLKAGAAKRRMVEMTLERSPQALMWMDLPYLEQMRPIALACAARSALAERAGDADAFFEAVEEGLGLVRALGHGPFAVESLYASAYEKVLLQRLVAAMMPGRARGWAERGAAVLDRQCPGVPREYPVLAMRIVQLDGIASVFSDADLARFGKYSPKLVGVMGMGSAPRGLAGRLGTFGENRRATEVYYADLIGAAAAEPWLRKAPPASPRADLILSGLMAWSTSRMLEGIDDIETLRRGVRTMMAVEQHQDAVGRYPERISDIAPTFIGTAPIDPWSGAPFMYVRIDPLSDRLHRPYLLYSIGPDKSDDGGKELLKEQYKRLSAGQRAYEGYDEIINRPSRDETRRRR